MGQRNRPRRLMLEPLSPRLLLATDIPNGLAGDSTDADGTIAPSVQLAPPLATPSTSVATNISAPTAPLQRLARQEPDWLRSVPVVTTPLPLEAPHGSFPGKTLPPIDVAQRLRSSSAAMKDIQSSQFQPFKAATTDATARQFFVGDFDGDGCNELAGFVDGQWWIDRNGDGVQDERDAWAQLGDCSDLPFVADVDGDGKDELGIRTQRGEVRIAEVRTSRAETVVEDNQQPQATRTWELAEATIVPPTVAQLEISKRR